MVGPIKLLNVDLSAITRSADTVIGIGEPLKEVVHLEFQSTAAAWKHADLLVYNALIYAEYHVPVHSVVLLLRPEAAHENMTGRVTYAPRPEHGRMDFGYHVVRLWEIDAERLVASELGVTPLAICGRFPPGTALEDGVTLFARRIVERASKEASAERAGKLITKAMLLSGLRVQRNVALKIFRGIPMMRESDTYLMILEEGEEKARREDILDFGEERLGPCAEAVRTALSAISDLARLKRMVRRAAKADSWEEIIETP